MKTSIIILILIFTNSVLTFSQEEEKKEKQLIQSTQLAFQSYEKEHGNYIQTDNVKMHYLSWGNPKDTPLIWIHGTFSNAYELFDIVPEIVNKGVYVIAIDYYAHGLTPLPDKEVSLYHIADDIDFLMKKLKIEKAIIGGWSRGGTIATTFYDAYPSKVLGLILEDGGSVAWDVPYHKEEITDYEKDMNEYFSTYKAPTIYQSESEAYESALKKYDVNSLLKIKSNQRKLLTKVASLQNVATNNWQFNPMVSKIICEDSGPHYLDAVHRTFQANTLFAISSHLLYPKIIYRNLHVPTIIFDPLGADSYFDFELENRMLKNTHPNLITLKTYNDSWHGVKHQHPKRFIEDITVLINDIKQKAKKKKILFVTTNIHEMLSKPNGTYLIELAVPFGEFTKHNLEIDIVSPKGGHIPIYHSGDTTDMVKAILKTELFKTKTQNSLSPKDINPAEYLAVIIPGGYGQFWDTHQNKDIQKMIASIYENGGIIGTLGHGSATLIDVKLKSGAYLVKNKTMTSFPTWYEKNIMEQSNFGKVLPYDMETELKNRGANLLIYDRDKKTNYEIVDAKNRLITASFASSGIFVAGEIMKLIEQN